jgi:hypothetical protein
MTFAIPVRYALVVVAVVVVKEEFLRYIWELVVMA